MDDMILELIDFGVEDEYDEDDEEGSSYNLWRPHRWPPSRAYLEENGFEESGAEFTQYSQRLEDSLPGRGA